VRILAPITVKEGLELSFTSIPGNDILLIMTAGLLATGIVAGLLAGLLGVGGGIVIVPVLFLLFSYLEVPDSIIMHMAVTTSLATIIPISLSSAREHYRRDAVDIAVFRHWSPFMLVAAGVAAAASGQLDSRYLQLLFGGIAIYVALTMIRGKTSAADAAPTTSQIAASGRGIRGGVISALIGAASSLMGIGGGSIAVPVLSALALPVHRAVGTAAAFGFLIAVPGALGFIWAGFGIEGRLPFSLGFVNLPAAIIIFSTSLFTVPLGSRIAHALNPKGLRRAFGFFLLLSAANILSGVIA